MLPGVLEQAGYPVSGLLTTHGDWDHLLGRLAFPGAAVAAGESTVARLGSELGQAHRELRDFDAEHYVTDRPPLSLGSLQSLPVPGQAGDRIGAGRPRTRAVPDRRPHPRRHRVLAAVVQGAGLRRLPVAGRAADDLPGRVAGGLPGNARPAGGPGGAGRMGRPRSRRADHRRGCGGGARRGPRLPRRAHARSTTAHAAGCTRLAKVAGPPSQGARPCDSAQTTLSATAWSRAGRRLRYSRRRR